MKGNSGQGNASRVMCEEQRDLPDGRGRGGGGGTGRRKAHRAEDCWGPDHRGS